MKFHCDRCKTRYSIADERVRGKILKIRCKNCSSVITVKETGQVSPPRVPIQGDAAKPARAGARRRAVSTSGSALQGAFEQALRRPSGKSPADSLHDAPAVLEAEWYVSQDGEQFGPFPLQRAQDWVSLRPADEELYCWSEGFDDWLPVDKVSHFRGLREPREQNSGLLPLPDDENDRTVLGPPSFLGLPEQEETPVPLFAATMAQVLADAPNEPPTPDREPNQAPMFGKRNGSGPAAQGLPSRPPAPAANPPAGGPMFAGSAAPSHPPGETRHEESHDLEIGEASRVVKLPMLARNLGGAQPMGAPGLPGVGGVGGVGSLGSLGRGTGSNDQHPTEAHAGLPVIQGGNTVDLPRPEILLPRRRRAGTALPILIGSAVVIGVVSVLVFVAVTGDDEDALVRRGRLSADGLAYQFEDEDGAKKGDKGAEPAASKSGARRSARRSTAARSGASSAAGGILPVGPGSSDEVDLSGGDAARELGPDDLFDVYNANKIGVQMCYNNALKRDPLLAVKRADVSISVGTTGSVSSVSIPSLSGTPLGECLEKRIRVWKFPRAIQVFNSKFPIIFQT